MLPNLHHHPLTTFGRTVVLAHAHVLVGREPCFAGVADLHGRGIGKTGKDKDKKDKQDFKLSEEEEKELMITFLGENECIWNKKCMGYRTTNIRRIPSVCSACIRRWSSAPRACPASF